MTAERVLMTLLVGGIAIGCVLVLYPFFSSLLWAAVISTTLLTARGHRFLARLRRGVCPRCRYSLEGVQGRCPECGWKLQS